MRTLWGRSGHPLSLPCSVDAPDDSNFSLEWRKNKKLILSAYGKDAGHAAPALQGRFVRGAGLGLTIHAVRQEDRGEYHCVVTRFTKQPTRPETGLSLRLVVNEAPKVRQPPQGTEHYVKEGDDFRMECTVDGAPPPEVSWSKNNKIVSSSPILHLTNVSSSDQGRYTCLAINVEGKEERSFDLRFSKTIGFEFAPTNKTVSEGSNVFWHCHAKAQPNELTYKWNFAGKSIKTTPTGLRSDIKEGDLSLREVKKSDRGWYECEATNVRGEKAATSAYLDVQYVPEMLASHSQVVTVGYGRNGTIECGIDANPPATRFSWSKNGHFLGTYHTNVFVIVDARDSDGGIYHCHATNTIGQGSAVETHIIVAEPPMFSVRPAPVVRAAEGTQVELACDGFGDPMPIIYWIRNQTRISSSTLSFPVISHVDHGRYECVISNSVASVSSFTEIIVEKARPQPSTIGRVICRSEEEMEVFWEPGYDGSMGQSFVVHFQSEDEATQRSVATTNTSAVLTELLPFSVYEIQIESRNKKGSTFSKSVKKPVCSTLPSPSNVHFEGDSLVWDRVQQARSYRVETRLNSKHVFRETGETASNQYRLGDANSWKFMEARVRSLRQPFSPSKPSNHAQIGPPESSVQPMGYALCGGIVAFFIVFIIWFCRRRTTKEKRKMSKKYMSRMGTSSGSQPQTETFCEPSINLWPQSYLDDTEIEDGADYDEWHSYEGSRIRYPQDLIGMEFDSDDPSPLEDMLRQKYIYGAEDVPAQLVADLRIERLKREFKQSHL